MSAARPTFLVVTGVHFFGIGWLPVAAATERASDSHDAWITAGGTVVGALIVLTGVVITLLVAGARHREVLRDESKRQKRQLAHDRDQRSREATRRVLEDAVRHAQRAVNAISDYIASRDRLAFMESSLKWTTDKQATLTVLAMRFPERHDIATAWAAYTEAIDEYEKQVEAAADAMGEGASQQAILKQVEPFNSDLAAAWSGLTAAARDYLGEVPSPVRPQEPGDPDAG